MSEALTDAVRVALRAVANEISAALPPGTDFVLLVDAGGDVLAISTDRERAKPLAQRWIDPAHHRFETTTAKEPTYAH